MAGLGEYVGSAEAVPMPAIQKALPENAQTLNLVDPAEFKVGNVAVSMSSRRDRADGGLQTSPDFEELSYLLGDSGVACGSQRWAAFVPHGAVCRSPPPFETYVAVHRVEG